MYVSICNHAQCMYEHIQTIYKHFAVVLLNLFRQQYRRCRCFLLFLGFWSSHKHRYKPYKIKYKKCIKQYMNMYKQCINIPRPYISISRWCCLIYSVNNIYIGMYIEIYKTNDFHKILLSL